VNWKDGLADLLERSPAGLRAMVPAEQRADLRYRLGRFRPWEAGFDGPPPPPAPGQSVGPPDFVGIGTQMSGTDWWYRLIADHPAVTSRRDLPVARHYLTHFAARSFGPPQVEEYHAWFPRRAGTITGEWTPSYAARPWVPALLARACPEARLVLMVRDPVDRLRLGLAGTADSRDSQAGDHTAEAVERGFYAAQLRRVLEHVRADRVLTLQYERCVADPADQIAATYRFLGLDDTHRPPGMGPPPPDGDAGPPFDPDTRRRLADLYADDVSELSELVPGLELSRWPSYATG
jgi:hypothetical protein